MSNINPQSGAHPQGSSGNANGGNPDDPSKQAAPDLFAGIDMDEIPDDVRTKLEAVKTTVNQTLTEKQQLEQRRIEAENFARQQQSRADRALSALQRHNLSVDGPTQPNQSQSQEQIIASNLVKDGLKPEIAAGYAKMLAQSNSLNREGILGDIQPLAQTVAQLQANQLLSGAKSQFANVFAIEPVAKAIEDNVNLLLSEGKVVNQATINHLVEMSYGKHVMQNPHAMTPSNSMQVPNFGGGSVTTGGYTKPTATANGAPQATQPETISIMNAITAELNRGIPTKKGGK